MARSNPFVYGEVVPKSAFVGRKAELDRLVADLADGQKVFLISPRRYGKSSLIRHAFAALGRDRIDTLEVTVSSFSSYVAFLEGYVRALAGVDARSDGRSWLRDLFTTFTPELRADPGTGGGLAVSFPAVRTPRDASRLGAEVFALPARIAARRGRRLVIAMDEFQAVTGYDAGNVEQTLRAAVQLQRQVGYVFAGSEPSLMEQMVSSRRPFYKAGPIVRLGRIPPDVFAKFIDDRFKKAGLTPEAGLGAAIVDVAGNLPYDVQRLAHETWDDVTVERLRTVGLEDVHRTLHRLLAEQEIFFESLWQRLTLSQRAALRAVVLDHGHEILGADVRTRYRLGGASSVQTSLAALQRLDLIAREDDGRYSVVDSLMREWVARKTY
jgi:energy-coupling factor transporter ATP-binding protein EcfA2